MTHLMSHDDIHHSPHHIRLRPDGMSLTEDDHALRATKQAKLVDERIAEVMESENPLAGIMALKLAHRGLGYDERFDEAINALREAFKLDDKAIRSASAEAFAAEEKRRDQIKRSARAAARRAGLTVSEDVESLAPAQKGDSNAGTGNTPGGNPGN